MVIAEHYPHPPCLRRIRLIICVIESFECCFGLTAIAIVIQGRALFRLYSPWHVFAICMSVAFLHVLQAFSKAFDAPRKLNILWSGSPTQKTLATLGAQRMRQSISDQSWHSSANR